MGQRSDASVCHRRHGRQCGDGQGLLEAWARDACVAVTDEYPCFFSVYGKETEGAIGSGEFMRDAAAARGGSNFYDGALVSAIFAADVARPF
jgi:hypothetical protein